MEFNKIKSKTTKIVAMFLALSFAATLFSTPGMTGTATAQQNACPPGYTFNPQQGQCIDGSACPPDTVFNPSTNTCVDGPPSCPQGTRTIQQLINAKQNQPVHKDSP